MLLMDEVLVLRCLRAPRPPEAPGVGGSYEPVDAPSECSGFETCVAASAAGAGWAEKLDAAFARLAKRKDRER